MLEKNNIIQKLNDQNLSDIKLLLENKWTY